MNNMLKVKAYESFGVVLLILIAAFFLGSGIIVAIVNAFGDQEPRLYYGAILVSAVGCIFLAIAILVPVCCTTYDTYDENGIVRTKRGKVLLEIKWGEVIEAEYLGWIWILVGAPLSLSLCMRMPDPTAEGENAMGKFITLPLKKKDARKIAEFVPLNIKNLPKKRKRNSGHKG